MSESITRTELDSLLPAEPEVTAFLQEIRDDLAQGERKIVVLDDDPTGTQTVHDVDVLTTWAEDDLKNAVLAPGSLFYVLTNSRALPESEAINLAETLRDHLEQVQNITGTRLDVISRSDSTLRGHYPAELLPLASFAEPDGHLIVPAFPEGGRITVRGLHYVLTDDTYIPVTETDFSRDPTFGYSHAHLAAWVEEKTAGAWKREDVLHVSIDHLRTGGPNEVRDVLVKARGNQPIISDAVTYADLTLLATGLARAEKLGKRFLARTGASFVRVRGGLSNKPLLTRTDLGGSSIRGGLVLVGSYVDLTALQLTPALKLEGVDARELSVLNLLAHGDPSREAADFASWVDGVTASGRTALVYTSRDLVTEQAGRTHIQIAALVSSALSGITQSLTQTPAWIIAKGGITSSDIATKGLGVRRARVLGQVSPGIPAWQLGEESSFPGVPYIVFPGNVGTTETLAELITLLSAADGKGNKTIQLNGSA